jgi:hypothetical protein
MANGNRWPDTVIVPTQPGPLHRQNGEGSVAPKGTLVQPSHWGWKVASFVLILAILAFIFTPAAFVSAVQWVFGSH